MSYWLAVATEAAAQTGPPPALPEFAGHPVLQLVSGLLTLVIGAFGWFLWYQGQRSQPPAAREAGPPVVTAHFDGVVVEVMRDWRTIADSLRDVSHSMGRTAEGIAEAAAAREFFTKELQQTRHHLANVVQGSQEDSAKDYRRALDAIDAIRREIGGQVEKVDERVRRLEGEARAVGAMLNSMQAQLSQIQSTLSERSGRR